MKILMTEGAGLTSRQVATQLDHLGHEVSAATSDLLCLARFTRHVQHLVPVPDFGPDPLAWFDAMLEAAIREGVTVVFPTQEQVTVLSHQLPRLHVAGLMTAVPPFAALLRVQDKLSAQRTLDEVGVPQPHTVVVRHVDALNEWSSFPAYVKAPVGSSSIGVRRVTDRATLAAAVTHFLEAGALHDGGVLVQEAVEGTFVMAQCVFDAGDLVAFHANERVQEGANGSGALKRSISVPTLQSDLARLGRALDWHGALSVDAIVNGNRAYVIDVNPRLVEPGNALVAGTDMVSALLAVALGRYVAPTKPSREGARTHQLVMVILGAAQRGGRRRDVLAALGRRLFRRGDYAGSREELTPWRGDWRTLVLPIVATAATLVRPAWWTFFTNGAVSHYALAPEGWRQLRAARPLTEVTAASA